MTHELTHATVRASTTRARARLAVRGLRRARRVPSPSTCRRRPSSLRRSSGSGRPACRRRCRPTRTSTRAPTRSPAAYGLSLLALRTLADAHGTQAVVRLYRAAAGGLDVPTVPARRPRGSRRRRPARHDRHDAVRHSCRTGRRASATCCAEPSGVELLDLVGVVLHDDVALELERGRQVAVGLGEVARQARRTCGSTRPWRPPRWPGRRPPAALRAPSGGCGPGRATRPRRRASWPRAATSPRRASRARRRRASGRRRRCTARRGGERAAGPRAPPGRRSCRPPSRGSPSCAR